MGFHAVSPHNRRHTEGNIGNAVLAVHHGRDWENALFIHDNGPADSDNRHGNAVIGGFFLRDDLVGAVFDVLRDLTHGFQ